MTSLRIAKVISVVGLGFGDEGKGTTIDYLARKYKASLVVRFNGGPQAQHNVVLPDGQHHTFSQYGSGTFAGARTHLARFMLVDPRSLENEHFALRRLTTIPTLTIERECPLITPWHKAANKHREWALGKSAHGSCGMGIGETRQLWLLHPDEVPLAADLVGPRADLVRKLRFVFDRYKNTTPYDQSSTPENVADRWRSLAQSGMFTIVDRDFLPKTWPNERVVIFEGSQGALLDQDWGFQPHTTWSNTTFDHAHELLADVATATSCHCIAPHVRVGVVRAYQTRHGAGPLPTEDKSTTERFDEPHNNYAGGGFAGPFRAGCFDWTLFRYALNVVKGVDTIALTHLDRSKFWQQAEWGLAPGVNGYDMFDERTADIMGPYDGEPSFTRQCQVTEFVRALDPTHFKRWESSGQELIETLDKHAPVSLLSYGPTHEHKIGL
jgi:adenylosuccinate synthase